ncbi:MAG: transglycosylase SLT domain-containing protein [Methylococcaceae bacterium]|nr:transglycosylase SLT domain-containing protein [Methylococcaceae bacterium]
MNKPATTRQAVNDGTKPQPKRKPRATGPRKSSRKPDPAAKANLKFRYGLIIAEILSLVTITVSAIIVLLGYSANRFSGTSFFGSLLPFAIGVLILALVTSVFLLSWWKTRKWLSSRAPKLLPVVPIGLALIIGVLIIQDKFTLAYGSFRTLVGGKQEASRVTLAHQVYAAYRRYNANQLSKLVGRAQAYQPFIEEAAKIFDIDQNLLQGVAATESSFLPRNSSDGGRGLFQITSVPKSVLAEAGQELDVPEPLLNNPRHNTFVAAATLKYYLEEMNNDLFMGLLAYNIGSKNGGLRFIMQQYGAKDFVTIQPYLQVFPRDYPIRVLSYSLAFRLWEKEGKLLAYEEGDNAARIQRIGIPGLDSPL